MGRIAEALKKAERERQLASTAEPSTPTAPRPEAPPDPTANPAAVSTDVQSVRPVRSVSEGMSEALVAYYDTSSMITEQYRSLRTRLLSMNSGSEPQVLAVTSAVPREGKSVTALNLAVILSEIQHLRVLVIDGDFRRSSLARLLNQPGAPGLADMLRGQATLESIIQPTAMPNLMFAPAGKMGNRSAADLLSSETLARTLRKLQTQYQYIIVDTPPATTVTDVGVIGQLCHAVVMVIRMNRTPGPVVRRAVRMLQVNNIPVAGCVLVGRNERNTRYGYYYGYYPYYRYYNDYYHREREE
ncbi:MAG: CpsD/CapB family tyrosine-protein kinase [Phycisphaerae bacterium]|nr:CpsD/CapB family tyrosine-protein kinase [Phycisphaerae bacterium]